MADIFRKNVFFAFAEFVQSLVVVQNSSDCTLYSGVIPVHRTVLWTCIEFVVNFKLSWYYHVTAKFVLRCMGNDFYHRQFDGYTSSVRLATSYLFLSIQSIFYSVDDSKQYTFHTRVIPVYLNLSWTCTELVVNLCGTQTELPPWSKSFRTLFLKLKIQVHSS